MKYLLLVILLTSCAAVPSNIDGMRRTAGALEVAADSAERATVQARQDKAARATLEAGAYMQALGGTQAAQDIANQQTAQALQVQQTSGAGTVTAQAIGATTTVEARNAWEGAYSASIQREVRATQQSMFTTATAEALEREERNEKYWSTFWHLFPWVLISLVLIPLMVWAYITVSRHQARNRFTETTQGPALYVDGIPYLLAEYSMYQRLASTLPHQRGTPPQLPERAEHAEQVVEHRTPAHPVAELLTAAVDVAGWYENKIPGHRELGWPAAKWDKPVSMLKERELVTTSPQGTFVVDGTIADLWHTCFRRGRITL